MVENEYTLTIFTPTYNRGYILEQLYESLLRQSVKDFYWLIVDDGSTDSTEDIVKRWIQDGKIEIEYHKVKNSGKAAAMNIGLDVARGQLFFCVDSDDYLNDDAVEKIVECFQRLEKSNIGILAAKGNYKTNELITKFNGKLQAGKLNELYRKNKISGDTALIYKTEIMKKYRFPIFSGEKFVPEAYLYDLMDQEGELLILPEVIYFVDYLEDGYTGRIKKIIFDNPNGYYAYISQRLKLEDDIKSIFFDDIRCVSINMVRKKKDIFTGTKKKYLLVLAAPLAVVYYMKTFYRYKKDSVN